MNVSTNQKKSTSVNLFVFNKRPCLEFLTAFCCHRAEEIQIHMIQQLFPNGHAEALRQAGVPINPLQRDPAACARQSRVAHLRVEADTRPLFQLNAYFFVEYVALSA